jgi:hypothetical protein
MGKYYFQDNKSEYCYDKAYFDSEMEFKKITEIEVFEAIPERIEDVFWCTAHGSFGTKAEKECGRNCDNYKPRNKISGICRHYYLKSYRIGKKVVLEKS